MRGSVARRFDGGATSSSFGPSDLEHKSFEDRLIARCQTTDEARPRTNVVDKITTIPRSKLGERVGQLDDADTIRPSHTLVVFLGLAGA